LGDLDKFEKSVKKLSTLGNFVRCGICGRFDWEGKHKCPPVFYFKHESYGDEWKEIRGTDIEQAAEEFAKKYNEEDGEYCLMQTGSDGQVEVLMTDNPDGGEVRKFVVLAEPAIYYSATEKKDG